MALKADITALETEKKLLMDEIDSLKKASIENSNAPYLTVSDYGDVTLAKNSVGVGTLGVDGVTVENLVVNGDFSADDFAYWGGSKTGWIVDNGTGYCSNPAGSRYLTKDYTYTPGDVMFIHCNIISATTEYPLRVNDGVNTYS